MSSPHLRVRAQLHCVQSTDVVQLWEWQLADLCTVEDGSCLIIYTCNCNVTVAWGCLQYLHDVQSIQCPPLPWPDVCENHGMF